MSLLEPKLGGIFNGQDAFGAGQVAAENVQQGGLTGAGSPGNNDILAQDDAGLDEIGNMRSHGAEVDEVFIGKRDLGELPDGETGSNEGEGMDDRVHAGSVLETSVYVGLALVDAAPDRRDNPLDNGQDRCVVHEGLV